MRPCVFLDRDDTLISNREATARTSTPGDLFDPALVRLLPGAGEACRDLACAGLALVVVTNQAGVAEGLCTLDQVEATNERMRVLLRGFGVELDGVYYSPFLARGSVARFSLDHSWRKPGPGMILAAIDELDLDPARSWMVGDAERDMQAAIGSGLARERCVFIGSSPAWTSVPDASAAARLILGV